MKEAISDIKDIIKNQEKKNLSYIFNHERFDKEGAAIFISVRIKGATPDSKKIDWTKFSYLISFR